jgi:RNA polymerase sigma-70 factor (ECF subfamily)
MGKKREISTAREEESDLVRKFQEGEERAFDELVLRYQDIVFRICLRFFRDYEEARDCAQDTFVRVYRSIGRFRFESKFSTWLYRITVNTCKNTLSSGQYRKRQETVSLDPSDGPDGRPVEVENGRWSPHGIYEKKAQKETIERAVQRLPKDQRTMVILRDIENLPYDEIADITGFPPGTVKSKLFRARKKLVEELRGVL